MSNAIAKKSFPGTPLEGVTLTKGNAQAAETVIPALPRIVQLLPDLSKAKAFAVATVAEMNKIDDKYQCDPLTVINAAFNCAALGLMPGGALGHAYFVPKKNSKAKITECQLWVGYRGFSQLGYQTGFLKDIYADVVFEGEPVEVWTDDSGQHIRHDSSSRLDQGEQGRTVRCAYMVWNSIAGGRGVSIVPGKELYALKTKQGNVWDSNFVQMCIKTPIRRGWKFWQVSGDAGERLAYAVKLDEQSERDESQDRAYLPSDIDAPQKKIRLLSEISDETVEDAETEPAVERSKSFVSLVKVIAETPDDAIDDLNMLWNDIAAALDTGDLTEEEAGELRKQLGQKVPY